MTEKDWEKLEQLTEKFGYPSISSLLEALARQEVSFSQLLNTIKK